MGAAEKRPMVLIHTICTSAVTFHGCEYEHGEVIKAHLDKTSTLGDLAQEFGGVAWPPRLICRGTELELSKCLEEQGCQTKDKIYLLDTLKNTDCKAWAKTGRCTHGAKCPCAKSHTMALSPRYVEHREHKSPSRTP